MDPSRRRALQWSAVTAVVAAVAAVAGTWLVLERRYDERSATPVEQLRRALRARQPQADVQRALERALAAAEAAGREPWLELLDALEPDEAREAALALRAWRDWRGARVARLTHALGAESTAQRLTSGRPAARERWRAALIALYGSELVGRLRNGDTVETLVDDAAARERAALPINRLLAAFHLGAAALQAGVPTAEVVDAGAALLDRDDPQDRAAGAEIVRLNAGLADAALHRRAREHLLAAARRESHQRTFFFLADGLAALNAAPAGGAPPLGVAELRPVYDAAGTRWRSTCLVAVRGEERQAELRRLVRALGAEARDDDALGAARTAFTLGDEPVQLEALAAWAARGGAAEPEAFTEATLRPLWAHRATREHAQGRILDWLDGAARRADAPPPLVRLLLTNAAFLGDDARFRARLAEAEERWVATLNGEGFWSALTAWAQLVPARNLAQALEELAERCRPGDARERLRGLADLPKAERRARAASRLEQARGAEAEWWRYASDAFGR